MNQFQKLTILPLFFLSACNSELPDQASPAPVTSEAEAPIVIQEKKLAVLQSSMVSMVVEPLSDPNSYSVKFTWPKDVKPFRIKSSAGKTFEATVADVGYSESVAGGKQYSFRFQTIDSNEYFDLTASVPVDLVLSGKIDYSGDKVIRANRLFISQDAVISTFRNSLDIKAKEIHSRGGLIQNYPPGFKECVRMSPEAYAGGNIKISSEVASGSLTISMSGATGCRWQEKGGKGGHVVISIDEGASFDPDIRLLRAQGGPEEQSFMPAGPPGDPGTSCVSLRKGEGNGCI